MKNQKLFLEDEEDTAIELGLIRLAKELPAHELFFHINAQNAGLNFHRKDDIHISGLYFTYYHSQFQGYHFETKNCLRVFSNKSVASLQVQAQQELFSEEEEHHYLMPMHKEVDYIIKSSDYIADFSVILLPENIMFPIQPYTLFPNEPLYDLILYYE